nr:MAG TPA: hypothetical protein [Caudoviricetes sp.]
MRTLPFCCDFHMRRTLQSSLDCSLGALFVTNESRCKRSFTHSHNGQMS